jgi:hypothetical protein
MNGCPTEEELSLLLTDQLPGEEQEALDAHLGDCNACQDALARLSDGLGVGQWRQWLRGEAAPASFSLPLRPPT